MQIIVTYSFNGRKNSCGEYVIRCYVNGKRHPMGDYFTDDKQDAQDTFRVAQELEQKRRAAV